MHCPYWSLPELLCMPLCLFTGHGNGAGVQRKDWHKPCHFHFALDKPQEESHLFFLCCGKLRDFSWNSYLPGIRCSGDRHSPQMLTSCLLSRKTFSRSGISGYSSSSQRRCFLSWALSLSSDSCCRATPVCVLAQSYLPGSGSKQRYLPQEY